MAISIDGADAATHDGNRGVAGSFDRSLRILADACDAGIPTQVNTTLTPANFDQIDAMADLLAAQPIVMWSVFFLVPVGRARSMPRLTAEQCEAAFERLYWQVQRQPYAIKTTEAPHYRRYVLQHQPSKAKRGPTSPRIGYVSHGVNDGKGVMFVGHTGDIYPSGFLPLKCGQFPRDSVVRVYQDSPLFRALREPDSLDGKCGQCEFRNVCGGSRARAYALTDNPFAEEPDCVHRPAIYQQR